MMHRTRSALAHRARRPLEHVCSTVSEPDDTVIAQQLGRANDVDDDDDDDNGDDDVHAYSEI